MFKPVNHPRGDKGGAQINRQPGPTGLHRFADRRKDILFAAQTAHTAQIAVRLFIDDVNNLIDGQTAHQLAFCINHRGADQVVTFKGTRHLFSLFVRLEGDRVPFHDVADPFLRRIEQNRLQLKLTQQKLIAQPPQIALYRRQRHFRTHDNHFELHDCPNGIVGVTHNLADARAFIRRHRRQ